MQIPGIKLARLAGGVFYICVECEVKIELLAPTTVRKLLLGNGKLKKEDVAKYLQQNVIDLGDYNNSQSKKKNSDEYDSLALCISWLKKYKLNNKE